MERMCSRQRVVLPSDCAALCKGRTPGRLRPGYFLNLRREEAVACAAVALAWYVAMSALRSSVSGSAPSPVKIAIPMLGMMCCSLPSILQASDRMAMIFSATSLDQHHHEFVAADPRHGIALAHAGRQAFGHHLQQAVASRVSKGVVDFLEVVQVQVQVQEQHRDLGALAVTVLRSCASSMKACTLASSTSGATGMNTWSLAPTSTPRLQSRSLARCDVGNAIGVVRERGRARTRRAVSKPSRPAILTPIRMTQKSCLLELAVTMSASRSQSTLRRANSAPGSS